MPYPKTIRDKCCHAYQNGSTLLECSREFGPSINAIWRWLKERNIPRRRNGNIGKPKYVKVWSQSLRKQGWTYKYIAHLLGVDKRAVWNWINEPWMWNNGD